MPRPRGTRPPSKSHRPSTHRRAAANLHEPSRESFHLSKDERVALEQAIQSVVPPDQQSRALTLHLAYLAELHSWNVRGNLVAASDAPRLVRRHIVESLTAARIIDSLVGRDLIDLGSGGGLPGIPLKLVRPHLLVALVESRRLKSLFLDRVCRKLELEGIWVWQKRAEHLGDLPESASGLDRLEAVAANSSLEGPATRPKVDFLTSRAVAPLPEIAGLAAPLVRPGGHLLTFKGSRMAEEIASWERAPGPWEMGPVFSEIAPGVHLLTLKRTEAA